MKVPHFLSVTALAALLPMAGLTLADTQLEQSFGYEGDDFSHVQSSIQTSSSKALYQEALWATDFEATDYSPGSADTSLERADIAAMEVIGVSRYTGGAEMPLVDRIMAPFAAGD